MNGEIETDRAAQAARAAQSYLEAYERRAANFEATVESFGLAFEPNESFTRAERTDAGLRTCHCENGGASLWRSWLSPACLACRRGRGTETFFVSMQCTRQCYFCFNPNQFDYEEYLCAKRDIAQELRARFETGERYEHLGITGGEPLLHPEEVLAFIRTARELYPIVHIRLYTNGDLLDDDMVGCLAKAGLDELRLSIKPFEIEEDRERLYARMAAAVARVPAVVVEMPVIPGSLEEMKGVLVRLDELGVAGINLLEFCFPLHNADEFRKRGFRVRKRPYPVLYNYWYAGGLPVAGSERLCVELLEFAAERKLSLGVHYCSLDNKHTSQLYQQNSLFGAWGGSGLYPWMRFDEDDLFLKCARAFGVLREEALRLPGGADEGGADGSWHFDERSESLLLPLAALDRARELFPWAAFLESYNVLEVNEASIASSSAVPEWSIQEVHVEPLFAR